MELLKKVWEWVNYNRFVVVIPVVGLVLWYVTGSCTPLTPSPVDNTILLNAAQLEVEFRHIVELYELARVDLEMQYAQIESIKKLLLALASGSVTTWPGLLQVLVGGGLLGAVADNIRKRGVISGLKRNKPDG